MHPHVPHLAHHHRTFVAGLAALALAVLAVAVPAQLGESTLTFSSASHISSSRTAEIAAPTRPAWLDRPLASPLVALR